MLVSSASNIGTDLAFMNLGKVTKPVGHHVQL